MTFLNHDYEDCVSAFGFIYFSVMEFPDIVVCSRCDGVAFSQNCDDGPYEIRVGKVEKVDGAITAITLYFISSVQVC